ncbi:hypothetical protein NL676_009364 [Syzygium grande]|nr:hypothetical protein NL676_009364 [Syzygium grande]
MASKSAISPAFLCSIILTLVVGIHAGGIAIYWGRDGIEGTSADTCASRNYKFINLAFLPSFDNGQTPRINLANHCNPYSRGCTGYSSVTTYLWDNFLETRPSHLGRQCSMASILILKEAPHRIGVIWLEVPFKQAYSTPFPFGSNFTTILSANTIIATRVISKIHGSNGLQSLPEKSSSGLPATPDAANDGCIPAPYLTSIVLPAIRGSAKYEGVMLWFDDYDDQTGM